MKREIDDKWRQQGHIDAPLPQGVDVKKEIERLCRERNAVVMAHYYTAPQVQEVAHFVGDSLALAQRAAQTDADVIVMCGVHFMGETAKILCPDKTVLVPDLTATCSLAESCPADRFAQFVKAHPGHTVVSYVNTTAATKAVTDVVVTSSNARQIVESLPQDEPIIFGPDRNLGHYINSITGRNMILWDGCCHVHDRFDAADIQALQAAHPQAHVLVHPESRPQVVALAHRVGSTAALLQYCQESEATEFIVVTESGILHEMQKACPHKTFIPVPPHGISATCNECEYMKLITLQKVYNTLLHLWPAIEVDPQVATQALKPIQRMLELSKKK